MSGFFFAVAHGALSEVGFFEVAGLLTRLVTGGQRAVDVLTAKDRFLTATY